MTTVAIHQPEYLPWLGLLQKMKRADVFVILDDVQFNRASFQHRARIAHPDGHASWLTIPFVHRYPQRINEVETSDPTWVKRHAEQIRNAYTDAPHFASMWSSLGPFYATPRTGRIVDPVVALLPVFADAFGFRPEMVCSSDLDAEGQKSDRVLDICRRLKATRYLCGETAAHKYLDHAAFATSKIKVVVQQYDMPRYRNGLPDGFTLSALDAWAHRGERAKELIA